ncbi:MAG: carbohydrate kinase [Bacteroidales bacterium]|nr:carbohydrate kinase [Clostridium sp.]MCM1203072.1 carbohydrate kinase [Bacteroidales bacterium]
MGKLIGIGEALIDMIPTKSGSPIKEVPAFSPIVGGAPANVCGAYSKLGGESYMITQLGKDPFGDKIIDNFRQYHIHDDYVSRTDKANTALAFVALKEDGNREFSFYRSPSADMLLEPEQIKREWFDGASALHFCSVSLGDTPMKQAHKQAVAYAAEAGCIISFDPNLRFNLWKSEKALKEAVWEFLPYAHVLKVSDEELEFITGTADEEKAVKSLFTGNVSLILYTKGEKGAMAYTKKNSAGADGVKVKAVDTTGAGDAFIGSFLFNLVEELQEIKTLDALPEESLVRMLEFSNAYCAKSVLRQGAIASYPTLEEMSK